MNLPAAGLTLTSIGWAHEGDCGRPGSWDRSALGFPSTWADDELLPGHEWPPVSSKVASGEQGADRKGKSRSSSFNLSSMPPAHAIEYGYQYDSGHGGGERRSRSGTIMPGSMAASDSATTASLPPLQPPLSVAIDYSGGVTSSSSSAAANGAGNWSTSHSRSASAASVSSAAYRSSSAYGGGHSRQASGSGYHSPGFTTPTGGTAAAAGGRSPTGSIYGGVSSSSSSHPPVVVAVEDHNLYGANNAETEAAHRSGWRKFGEETTEEELERRKLEEEDRELMG